MGPESGFPGNPVLLEDSVQPCMGSTRAARLLGWGGMNAALVEEGNRTSIVCSFRREGKGFEKGVVDWEWFFSAP